MARACVDGRGQAGDEIVKTALGDTDDYLAGWERASGTTAGSTPVEVVDRVTSELDAEWPADRIAEYLTGLGR